MQLLRQDRFLSRTRPDSLNIAAFRDRKTSGAPNHHDPANAKGTGKCNHCYIAGRTTDG
jgi:hypothetical protein